MSITAALPSPPPPPPPSCLFPAVFVLNHASPNDFQPLCIRQHHSLLVDLFAGTKTNIEGIYTAIHITSVHIRWLMFTHTDMVRICLIYIVYVVYMLYYIQYMYNVYVEHAYTCIYMYMYIRTCTWYMCMHYLVHVQCRQRVTLQQWASSEGIWLPRTLTPQEIH